MGSRGETTFTDDASSHHVARRAAHAASACLEGGDANRRQRRRRPYARRLLRLIHDRLERRACNDRQREEKGLNASGRGLKGTGLDDVAEGEPGAHLEAVARHRPLHHARVAHTRVGEAGEKQSGTQRKAKDSRLGRRADPAVEELDGGVVGAVDGRHTRQQRPRVAHAHRRRAGAVRREGSGRRCLDDFSRGRQSA